MAGARVHGCVVDVNANVVPGVLVTVPRYVFPASPTTMLTLPLPADAAGRAIRVGVVLAPPWLAYTGCPDVVTTEAETSVWLPGME